MGTEGGVREVSSAEVPHEEGLEDESMHQDDEDANDEDVDKERESSSGSLQGSTALIAGLSRVSWENREDEYDPHGGLHTSQDSGSKGESEVGHPPAPKLPH